MLSTGPAPQLLWGINNIVALGEAPVELVQVLLEEALDAAVPHHVASIQGSLKPP